MQGINNIFLSKAKALYKSNQIWIQPKTWMLIYNKSLNLENTNLSSNRKTIKIWKIQIKDDYLDMQIYYNDIWIISKYLTASLSFSKFD